MNVVNEKRIKQEKKNRLNQAKAKPISRNGNHLKSTDYNFKDPNDPIPDLKGKTQRQKELLLVSIENLNSSLKRINDLMEIIKAGDEEVLLYAMKKLELTSDFEKILSSQSIDCHLKTWVIFNLDLQEKLKDLDLNSFIEKYKKS